MSSTTVLGESPAVHLEERFLAPQTQLLTWGTLKLQKRSFWNIFLPWGSLCSEVSLTTSLSVTATPSVMKWHSSWREEKSLPTSLTFHLKYLPRLLDKLYGPSWAPPSSTHLEEIPLTGIMDRANRSAVLCPASPGLFLFKHESSRFLFYNFPSELTLWKLQDRF